MLSQRTQMRPDPSAYPRGAVASPTFRYFVHRSNRSIVRVEILTANQRVIAAGHVQLAGSVAPSPVLLLVANALALQSPYYSTSIRIRFVTESGTARLDQL